MAYIGSVPTIDNVIQSLNQLTVDFTQTDVGSPPATYYYSLDGGNTILGEGVSASPLVITNVSGGISFHIVASNSAGNVLSLERLAFAFYLGTPPIINTITPGTNQLTVSFTQTDIGSSSPSYYYSFDGTNLVGNGVSASPLVITGISGETAFYIVASDENGNVFSDVSSGTPNYVGSKPVINEITTGDNQISVAFTQTNSGNPPASYYYSLNGTTLLGDSVASSPLVISNISAGTPFYIVASNSVGNIFSDASSSVVVPTDYVGTTPVITSVTPGLNQLTIHFMQDDSGNPAPTYYYSLDGTTLLGDGVASSPLVLSGLSGETTFYIVASNSTGNVFSDASSGTPQFLGSNPVVTSVVPGKNNLTANFTQNTIGNPSALYYYSLDGVHVLGSGVESSPLIIPTVNVPTNFYVAASNNLGNVFSSQTVGIPILVGLNDIAGNSLNIGFKVPDFSSNWINQYSYNCSQILYLQGLVNNSSPTGYEYVSAYVKYNGNLVVESYTNDISGSGFKSFEVSIEDRTNTIYPIDTLYMCNANINNDGTMNIGFYYYLTSTGVWSFSGSLTTDAISTTYSDWNVIHIGRGRSSLSGLNTVRSQLLIQNVEVFPIAGPWMNFYKLYLLSTNTTGTGSLSTPYYTFNYASISGNLPVRTYVNGNLTSGIMTFSDSKVVSLNPGNGYSNEYDFNYLTLVEFLVSSPNNNPAKIPCFGENTKILCFNPDTYEEEYMPIKNIRRGTLVKTLRNGYVKVDMIGKTTMENHYAGEERHKNRLYKCTKSNYPEMRNEDLILTGCHCILVDEFKNMAEREKTMEVNRKIYITDNKYRLPACVDERAKIYEKRGTFTIYHFALENDDYYMNYGIYANGLLVETSSKRYMKELSMMELI